MNRLDTWAEESKDMQKVEAKISLCENLEKEVAFEEYTSMNFMDEKLPDGEYVEYLNISKFADWNE